MAKARNTTSAQPKRKQGQQSRPNNRAASQAKGPVAQTKETARKEQIAQETATVSKGATTPAKEPVRKESLASMKETARKGSTTPAKEPVRKESLASTKETTRKGSTTQTRKPVRRGPTVRKKDRRGLYTVIGVLVLIALVIGGFVLLQRWQAGQQTSSAAEPQQAVDPIVLQQVTGVSQATWEGIGTGGVSNPLKSASNQPPLKGPNGHPEFFYVGGEYCPYCAAERWAMVNALSRFGTFKNLSQIISAESHISTFSFYRSSYTSNYIDFVPVEVNNNQLDASGRAGSLQNLTSAQQQTFNTYDNAPYFSAQSALAFPFMDIGNRYLAQGGSFQPTVLLDSSQNTLSWQDIASSLSNPSSPIAQNILGTANYLTAAICSQTNQQPGNVCSSPVIQKIEQSLGTALVGTSPVSLTLSPLDTVGVQRRFF